MSQSSVHEQSLDRVADLLGRRAGFALTGAMRSRLSRSVLANAENAGVDVEDYAGRVEREPLWLQRLIEDLTVQESSFFRDPGQFEALRLHVLPRLMRPVRIWSAGCSRGQEPYSLAMLLLESGHPDASVIGTDISTEAIAQARAGRYRTSGLRGLSPARQAAWLDRDGQSSTVREDVRRRVSFAQHNIAMDPPPFRPGTCQVVFCRNVLIYFRPDALVAALGQMRDWLPPGGMLFLGYSESLWQVTDMFEAVRLGDAFVYRKPEVSSTVAAPAPASADPVVDPAPPPGRGEVEREPLPVVAELLRKGELSMASNELGEATAAFRQAAYLDRTHPVAHFQLGLALEAQGQTAAAARAFRAARMALHQLEPAAAPPELLGYRTDALVRLINLKLGVGDQ
jgi:chemotaxis protein methyltransferase CheR